MRISIDLGGGQADRARGRARARRGPCRSAPRRAAACCGGSAFGARLRHAAQDGVDAQQQLARLEGLRQVVVGAGLQPADAVVGVAAGGQQQDRRRHASRAGRGQREAVLAGHHHVEHDQVELEPFEQPAGVGGVAGGGDQEAVAGEELLQQRPDPRVVVDDEHVAPAARVMAGRVSSQPSTRSRSSGSIIARAPCGSRAPPRARRWRRRRASAGAAPPTAPAPAPGRRSVRCRLRWRRSATPTRLSTRPSSTSWRSTRLRLCLVTPRMSSSSFTVRPGRRLMKWIARWCARPYRRCVEDAVGIGGEAAIGEEHQLDALAQLVVGQEQQLLAARRDWSRSRPGPSVRPAAFVAVTVYVRHVDIPSLKC